MKTHEQVAAQISAQIVALMADGHTLPQAFDLVIGEGAFMKLAGEVWEAFQPKAPAAPKARFSIKVARETIQTLNWVRTDRTGGTSEENKRCRLPEELAPYIAKVEALEIPARFARDIEDKAHALRAAAAVIERWRERQTEA